MRLLAWAENGHAWNLAADHGHFIATMKARAALAVFEDFVGQVGFVFYCAEAVLEEEVWNACKQANGMNAVVFCFFDECVEQTSTCALAFGSGGNDDGAHLG